MLFHNFELWLKRLENDVVIMISVIFFIQLYGFAISFDSICTRIHKFTKNNKFVIPCVTN